MIDIPKEKLKNFLDQDGKIMLSDDMPDDLKAAINYLNDNNISLFSPNDPLADAKDVIKNNPSDDEYDEDSDSESYDDTEDEIEEIEDIEDDDEDFDSSDLEDIF